MIKEIPSIKKMLFGIMIMLIGGFIMLNESLNLRGIEFFFILGGFLMGILGLFFND